MPPLRARILSLCVALAATLALVPSAAAQSEAPQVDPDSPAGTEYQLPIDRAREQAAGGSSGTSGSSGTTSAAPLFGEGVESSTSDSSKQPRTSEPAVRTDELGTSEPKIGQTRMPTADDGGSELAAIGAGAAGVLAIGGLAGLAWRRRTVRG